ncbi:MAG: 30S ribosomal protein S16 [Patescibacteria group bacterium]
MLKIRLQRVGRKHDPSYRVLLIDSQQGPKSGKFIENLGFYDTIRKIKQLKGERIKYWIGQGAQVSDTVHNILVSEKVIEGKKKNVLPKKSPVIDEAKLKAEAEAKEAKEKAEKEASETPVEETPVEAVAEEVVEEVKEETSAEEIKTA